MRMNFISGLLTGLLVVGMVAMANATTIYDINATLGYNYGSLNGSFAYDSSTHVVSNVTGVYYSENGATGHPYSNDLTNMDIIPILDFPPNILSFTLQNFVQSSILHPYGTLYKANFYINVDNPLDPSVQQIWATVVTNQTFYDYDRFEAYGLNDINAATIIAHPGPVTDPVPEPSTILLLGLGFSGLAGIKKKFKRSTQSQNT